MRRLVIALIAAGLAVSCGSLAVVVATVWLTPERPRPATPTVIVALAARPTGTPRGEGPPLFTPTAAPTDTPSPPTPPRSPTPPPAPAPPTAPPEASPTSPPLAATAPLVAPTAPPATAAPPSTPSPTPPPPTPAPSPRQPATATPRPTSSAASPTRPPTSTITPAPTRSPTPSPTPSPTRPPATATPTVQLTRVAPLVLTTTRLTLAPDQRASVGVSYSGRGQVAWTAFSDAPWLSVTPTSGTLAGETDVLTITARRGDLAAGTHQGRVIIEAGDGRATVVVTMLVPAP